MEPYPLSVAGTSTITNQRENFGLTNKQSLTVDTGDVNDLGLAKFRTQADNNKEQIYHYNQNKKDASFISFLAVRKQTSTTSEIKFSIHIF